MLAGIKELRMVDPKKVSEEDSTSQFLAPRDEVYMEPKLNLINV